MGHFMRIVLYIIGFIIAAAVAVIPWVVGRPITYIVVLVSLAGVAMAVLVIIGWVKGWPISFNNSSQT